MAELLLEIFSEEIPARMQKGAMEALSRTLAEKFIEARLTFASQKNFVTSRRLAFVFDGLPAQQPDITVEKKGPKVGAPEAAMQGFLKSSGLKLEQLEKRTVGKDEVYFAVVHQKGGSAAEAIKIIIDEMLAGFTWPKSMRWGAYNEAWVRPMHSILCLFDGKVIPVKFGPVTAGDSTRGHRFLSPDAFTVKDSKDYLAKLEKAHVIADPATRRAKILEGAEKLAASKNLALKKDDGLLDEVTGLVEWPVMLMGAIDKDYMDLPPEVLVSEMKNHQRYFALLTQDGKLTPHFIITSNMLASDGGKAIVAGNERVLRARLADGKFYWEQDRKTKLDAWNGKLKDVVFHARIGTVAQKVERITALAEQIATYVKGADKPQVKRASQLCKADLATGMVGEFPELQGVMGRYYALAQGEKPEVADAIRDHYLPLGPDSACPTAPASICVALADKLVTLILMFGIDERPTGSKDPFALRRSGLGIIRLILENAVRINLAALLEKLRAEYKEMQKDALITFFTERLKAQLRDQNITHDIVESVIPRDIHSNFDIVDIVARAKALQAFLSTDNGANLLAAYKRAANILSIEEKKDKTSYNQPVDAKLLGAKEETVLQDALANTATGIVPLLEQENYSEAMGKLSTLRPLLDAFFDKVLVNDKDGAVRANRLRLLNAIRETMDGIAHFAVIEGASDIKKAA